MTMRLRNQRFSPSPPQREQSSRCRQAKRSFAERRGEGRGEGDAPRAFPKIPATHPPHPNPLPGGERGPSLSASNSIRSRSP
ncbi:hypothetical protein FZ942_28205 [Azospirillum lipoferum]|uniref:Uncharacterized protein n=1 Tax=Azospirillum lipoferum TaxID=193 RepID=A0A5A9GDK1_AZOLI|nr:hypothetical protein FZ942_28205 [Azospirillum lipoferum]